MKKLYFFLLMLALICLLAACSSPAEQDGADLTLPDEPPPLAGDLPAASSGGAYEPGFNRADYFITILTGPTSGIYFPIGGAFFQLFDQLGYRSNATATGATAENINSLLAGDGELAIAMSDSVIQAYEAFGAYEDQAPATDLRALMGLWPNICQIVTTADTGITKFEDLKGKRVGVGAANSGVELNARMMFEAHDMTYDDCARVDYLNYAEAIEQIKNGNCDVAFVTSGLGNATIQELGVNKELVFIPVEGEALNNLISKYPFYIATTIPADAYGTQVDTTTAAVMNIMLVSKDLPNEVVYDLLFNIYSAEGLAIIHNSHAQAAENILLDTALRGIEGTAVPLHEGAVIYYQEQGLL